MRWPRRIFGLVIPSNITLALAATLGLGGVIDGPTGRAALFVVSGIVLVVSLRSITGRLYTTAAVLLFCYLGLYYIQPVVHPVVPVLDEAAYSDVLPAYSFMTIASIHLFVVAYALGFGMSRAPLGEYDIRESRLRNVIVVMIVVNCAAFGLLIWDAGGVGAAFAMSRVQRKESLTGLSAAAGYLLYAGVMLHALLPVYLRRRRFLYFAAAAALLGGAFVLFLVLRTRSVIIGQMVAFLLGSLVIAPRVTLRTGHAVRISGATLRLVRSMAVIALLAVIGGVGLYARHARGLFEQHGLVGLLRADPTAVIDAAVSHGDLGYAPTVLRLLQLVPSEHEYLRGQSYYRLAFAPIPRALWKGKPENTQRIVGGWLMPYGPSVQTIPPGMQGDAYINFGFAGVWVFALLGVLFARLDRPNGFHLVLLTAVAFAPLFHLARGGFTNPVILLGWLWIVAGIIDRYLRATFVSDGLVRDDARVMSPFPRDHASRVTTGQDRAVG